MKKWISIVQKGTGKKPIIYSSSGTYPVATKALERPDLIRGAPRTINMSTIGDALLDAKDPPLRAI